MALVLRIFALEEANIAFPAMLHDHTMTPSGNDLMSSEMSTVCENHDWIDQNMSTNQYHDTYLSSEYQSETSHPY